MQRLATLWFWLLEDLYNGRASVGSGGMGLLVVYLDGGNNYVQSGFAVESNWFSGGDGEGALAITMMVVLVVVVVVKSIIVNICFSIIKLNSQNLISLF